MKRVFMVHGFGGRPDDHWFPWLSLELSARGFSVHAPSMPYPKKPTVAEWVAHLAAVVGKPDAETYFVGHSLGCITIVRYLASLRGRVRVGGCVFVAGFSGNINIPQIAEFYTLPVDVESARRHARGFVCIFSDNDRDVPLPRSLEFAEALGAKAVLEKGKRHFTGSAGVTALPAAFSALMSLSSRVSL